MKENVNHSSQVAKVSFKHLWLLPLFMLSLAGCGGGGATDGGEVVNTFELPRGVDFTLWCPNAGIADEECVLFDTQNVFARSNVNDVTKWELLKSIEAAEASEGASFAKAKYYLWATALAKIPSGENQYYTALALHTLHKDGGSELARTQAQKAYRSVMDNYYDAVTFLDVGATDLLETPVRNLSGKNVVEPSGLPQLFGTSAVALGAIDEWGYIYDTAADTITKKNN